MRRCWRTKDDARGRAISSLIFDVLALLFTAVLLWQLTRMEWLSWVTGDVAPTELQTPLWIPRLVMPLGTAALCITLLKEILGDVRLINKLSEAR